MDAPPVLPPFSESSETIESAVQEQLDFAAQLKFQSRQLHQLAARQDAMFEYMQKRDTDLARSISRATEAVSKTDLILSRLRRITKHLKIPDGD